MMKDLVIITPDQSRFEFETKREQEEFASGFIAALNCFGIWKDGQQVIGCMETPISKYKRDMIEQTW